MRRRKAGSTATRHFAWSATLAAIGFAATPAAAQQAAPLIAQGCSGCHGQSGAGRGSVPKIAGYNRDLFIAQWSAFRKNERPATIMNRVATGYTDAEVAQLADYFSKLK